MCVECQNTCARKRSKKRNELRNNNRKIKLGEKL